MGFFSVKQIDRLISESEQPDQRLKKTFGPFSLMSLGVASVLGAGVFTLMAVTAAEHTGPAIALSFVLTALACASSALCYAEMASIIPITGSAYTYSYATVGELLAWIIGWDLILEYCIGAAAAAASCSAMIRSLLADSNIHLAPRLFAKSVDVDLLAPLLVLLITLILVRGARESAGTANVFVLIKVSVICGFVVLGSHSISIANWTPFIPPNTTGEWGRYGYSGVLQGAGLLFLAYIGFDSISTAAEESRNPQKDLPVAILGALAICTLLYVGFALTLTGNIRYDRLGGGIPLETSYEAIFSHFVALILSIGTAIGLLSLLVILLYGQARLLYAMSRDRLLPPSLSRVHPKFKTPARATSIVAVVASFVAAVVPFDILSGLTGIGTLFAFTGVCFCVLIIRKRYPHREHSFHLPFGSLIPIIGITVNIALMTGLGGRNWFRLGVWLALGLVVYLSYGRKHSEFCDS
jgi:basic amino acid/polyamine antiporter, APA family